MQIVKFTGNTKRLSLKRAVSFFYDNLEDSMKLDVFLAKCRLQKDGKTIHYYPGLSVKSDNNKSKKNEK